jgi:hypothetical protein
VGEFSGAGSELHYKQATKRVFDTVQVPIRRLFRSPSMLLLASAPSPSTADLIEQAKDNVLNYGCLLCRGQSPAESIGVFTPGREMASAFGEVRDRRRHILYGLCDCCCSSPDYPVRVEARLLEEIPRLTR